MKDLTVDKQRDRQSVTDRTLDELYEAIFPAVARFVSSRGGSFDQARDIFHDALMIYFEKSEHPDTSTTEAYIFGIVRHLWFRSFKRQSANVPLADEEVINNDDAPSVNTAYLFQVIRLTGRKCLDLLHAFYYRDAPVRDIAQALGYSSAHSAAVQKYKCLEKVRNAVKLKLANYDDFMD